MLFGYFYLWTHFSYDTKQAISARWLANSIHACKDCLIVHLDILFIIKVKIVMLIMWSYRSPQSCWVLSYTMVSIFWVYTPIFNKHMSFWCMFLTLHLTTYHSNIGVPHYCYVQFRHVYLICGSIVGTSSSKDMTAGLDWQLPQLISNCESQKFSS